MNYFFSILFFLFGNFTFGQLPFQLTDDRVNNVCTNCSQVIESKPKEVLFGVSISFNGDVYFSMDNLDWFHKIIADETYGISIDLVAKDRYKCSNTSLPTALPKGTILKPMYKEELLRNMEGLTKNGVAVKVGVVPTELRNKQLEGNLIIVKKNSICYYSNFVNIDRSDWNILSMGFFTDTLQDYDYNSEVNGLTNTKKVTLVIPFLKNSSKLNEVGLQKQFDSLQLQNYKVKSVLLRTFSSIEGSELYNENLSKKRSAAINSFIKSKFKYPIKTTITNAENWVEFYESLEANDIVQLNNLNKQAVKVKLLDKKFKESLEQIFQPQRKAILTLLVTDKKTHTVKEKDSALYNLQKAIEAKNFKAALLAQKNIANLIGDNELPLEYLNKIEVPKEKEFSEYWNDNAMYRLILKSSTEYETLQQLKEVYKTDSTNGKLNYNICALDFYIWNKDDEDSISGNSIKDKLVKLVGQGIDSSLVKRLWINYYILKCREVYNKGAFDIKDSLVYEIYDVYNGLKFTDEDILRIAKFYSYYSFGNLAIGIVQPRIAKVDISEDLIFYYLNLLFFYPSEYESSAFSKAMLNAININRKRFCDFFLPNHLGGASMQLLDEAIIRNKYCETCN